MPHTEILETVRSLVRTTFIELGARSEQQLQENILIRDDLYCGRRFQCADMQAVWFIEEDEIKIRGPRGTILRVISGPQPEEHDHRQLRKAA